MYALAKHRTLKPLHPFAFDKYSDGMILGNPLSAPLEEINPIHLMEQARRVTQMGPGGIGSDNAITEDMQAIHGSQFGFLSTLEGPECFDDKSEVYTTRGWVRWTNVRDDDIFACNVSGRLEWHKPDKIVREWYEGEILIAESQTLRMAVTPNHRVLYNWGGGLNKISEAEEVFGKSIKIPIRHEAYKGDNNFQYFELPPIVCGGNAQKIFQPFCIEDWCEYMGWWLSEGDVNKKAVSITQCPLANPEHHAQICRLVQRMGLVGDNFSGTCKKISCGAKQFVAYFQQWFGKGCYDKWIPEELFGAPIHARQRMLDALLSGDGRDTVKRKCYCTVSSRLALDVERLAIGLGYTAFIREEKDNREHVKTTNYIVSLHRQYNRQPTTAQWRKEQYEGMIFCATVPGGLLHVRGKNTTSGFWSGNSEKIGIDTRVAWGAKMGTDGRLYQLFRNSKTGKLKYMSPEDLDGSTVKLPD